MEYCHGGEKNGKKPHETKNIIALLLVRITSFVIIITTEVQSNVFMTSNNCSSL